MSEHILELVQTSFKILPFLAVILFELSPITFRDTFKSVMEKFFDSPRYRLIDESAIEILSEEFKGEGNISQGDVHHAFGRLQTQAGLADKPTRNVMADYATYSNDRLSTRLSLSVTGVSVLAIVLGEAAITVETWCQFIQLAVIVVLIIGFLIIVLNEWVSCRFEAIGPHEYSREIENGRALLPKYRIVYNLLIICMILLFDLIL